MTEQSSNPASSEAFRAECGSAASPNEMVLSWRRGAHQVTEGRYGHATGLCLSIASVPAPLMGQPRGKPEGVSGERWERRGSRGGEGEPRTDDANVAVPGRT